MKCNMISSDLHLAASRSREGAWIEIVPQQRLYACPQGRSREGAWIEMVKSLLIRQISAVAPARERGLKSFTKADSDVETNVAPARERGLKFIFLLYTVPKRGRSREGAWIEILVRC